MTRITRRKLAGFPQYACFIGSEDEHSPSESAPGIRLGARCEFEDHDSVEYP